jgi:hypothetical protein
MTNLNVRFKPRDLSVELRVGVRCRRECNRRFAPVGMTKFKGLADLGLVIWTEILTAFAWGKGALQVPIRLRSGQALGSLRISCQA